MQSEMVRTREGVLNRTRYDQLHLLEDVDFSLI